MDGVRGVGGGEDGRVEGDGGCSAGDGGGDGAGNVRGRDAGEGESGRGGGR
jgi:hypothetical protein